MLNFGGGMYIIERVRRATSGAETAYPSGGPEFTPGFSGVRVSFSHCLICPSIFRLPVLVSSNSS